MSIVKAYPSNPYPITPVVTRDIADGPALKASTLTVGGTGAEIEGILSGTTSWTPGGINNGASASKTVTVAGAAVGDVVSVGVYPALPAGVVASGQVTAGGTVTVTLGNLSGSTVTLAAGSIRVEVHKF